MDALFGHGMVSEEGGTSTALQLHFSLRRGTRATGVPARAQMRKLPLPRIIVLPPLPPESADAIEELELAREEQAVVGDLASVVGGLTAAFEVVITSDDVEHPKPAPDIYLLACTRLGVGPDEALALEDSPSGIAAAKAAGLACIAVPQFAETDVSAADRVIDSLEELLAEV